MKPKDKIDVLHEIRLVNACLTESIKTLPWLPNFYGRIENF